MKAYPQTMHAEAERLHKQGFPKHAIATKLGVGNDTIHRWLNPEYKKRCNEADRLRKQRYRGSCANCGAATSYVGRKGRKSSRLCQICARQQQRYWTRERIIEAIQRWATEHGKQPSSGDWIRRGKHHPAASAVYAQENPVFKSWSEALRAAGFQPQKRSPGRNNRLWPREEAKQLLDQGYTPKQLAARYGVTPSAISSVFPRPPARPKQLPARNREQRINDLRKALSKQDQ